MATVTLRYTPRGGVATTRAMTVIAVKGFDDPDEYEYFPNVIHHYLDGASEEQDKGFWRWITIDFGVISAKADRVAILDWLGDNARSIDYGFETDVRLLRPEGQYANEWMDNLQIGRRFIIRLREAILRQNFPAPTDLFVISTIFHNTTRLTPSTGGSGTVDISGGVRVIPGTTGTSFAGVRYYVSGHGNFQIYNRAPKFSAFISADTPVVASGTGSFFCGIGDFIPTGSGHTFTSKHIGFKILKTGGAATLYATQADGVTEKVSAALTTIVQADVLDLMFEVLITGKVDYYYRKNGGTLSARTTLTANLPNTATVERAVQVSASNDATAFDYGFQCGGFSYTR